MSIRRITSMKWSDGLPVVSSILIAVLAFWGARTGVERQLQAQAEALRRQDELEHGRWLRDQVDAAFLDTLGYLRRIDFDLAELARRAMDAPDTVEPFITARFPDRFPTGYAEMEARLLMYGTRDVLSKFLLWSSAYVNLWFIISDLGRKMPNEDWPKEVRRRGQLVYAAGDDLRTSIAAVTQRGIGAPASDTRIERLFGLT